MSSHEYFFLHILSASERVKLSTPPFAALYAAEPGEPTQPYIDAVLTIVPPPVFNISRIDSRATKNTPSKSTFTVLRHSEY